jgi:geranylgeranyl diphosphate synthase type II
MLSYEKLIEKIEASIAELETNKVPLRLYEPITYIMGLGGKRMRPMWVLLAYSLFKDDAEKIIKPAIGVEVFHNFTLMHDDIMDAAPLRRGMATVHTKWDANVAILSGDVMLVEAYRLMMDAPDMNLRAVINLFSKTAAEVCEGQMLDMDFELLPTVTVDEYINMIRLKTAVLLGFSLQLGGLLAGVSVEVQQ